MKKWTALLCLAFYLFSCKTSGSEEYARNGIYIRTSAGQPFENAAYLPSPFAHGYILNTACDTLEVLVIAKSGHGDRLEIVPLALITLSSNDLSTRDLVLAYPADHRWQSMSIRGYENFVVSQFSAKQIIDLYLNNYQGLGRSKVERWQSGDEAKLRISEFLKEN